MTWAKRLFALGALAGAVTLLVLVLRPQEPRPRAVATAPAKPKVKRRAVWKLPAAPADLRGRAARRKAVPILMYHVVSAPPPGVANRELWVAPDVFAAEMRALRKAGFHAVTLTQVLKAWRHGGSLPEHPVVVTFDDGYLSHYTHARPVLRRLGWPGVLYLKVDAIGPGGLSKRELRALLASGWEIDSHTITHPDLTSLDDAALRRELVVSRRELRKRLGVRADFFAYPAGRFDARVAAATRAAGYRAAVTTEEGAASAADDPFALPRVRVNGSDTPKSLLAKLAGAT